MYFRALYIFHIAHLFISLIRTDFTFLVFVFEPYIFLYYMET